MVPSAEDKYSRKTNLKGVCTWLEKAWVAYQQRSSLVYPGWRWSGVAGQTIEKGVVESQESLP